MLLSRPPLKKIFTDLQDDLARELGLPSPFSRRSILSALTYSLAGAIHLVYGRIESVKKQSDIDTATGYHLDRLAIKRGYPRRPETAATGVIKVAGSAQGLVIEKGSVFTNKAGDSYSSLDTATTDESNTAFIHIESALLGPLGKLPENEELTLTKSVAGINGTAKVMPGGIIEGFPRENDDQLRARLQKIRKHKGQGGSKDDYERWAQEIPGVGDVYLATNELDRLTIYLSFLTVDPSIPKPSNELISKLQRHINTRKPLGTLVIVSAFEGSK
ncbi:unnamed protein product [Sphagnum tenellum]